MILLELFLGFLKVGAFAFGGAYAAIPLIRETVLAAGWITGEELARMIAVSESTPGSIIVNLATYVGLEKAGVLGALVATLAAVLPAFLIIILVLVAFKRAKKNKYVSAALSGVKPCVAGIVLAVGALMLARELLSSGTGAADPAAIVIAAVLAALMLGFRIIKKKRLSPILLIIASAALGMLVYGV